jgi:hypothetical protein
MIKSGLSVSGHRCGKFGHYSGFAMGVDRRQQAFRGFLSG